MDFFFFFGLVDELKEIIQIKREMKGGGGETGSNETISLPPGLGKEFCHPPPSHLFCYVSGFACFHKPVSEVVGAGCS